MAEFNVGASGGGEPYQIQNSLMLDYASSGYLSWTPAGSGTDTNKFTFSMWFKGRIDDPDRANNTGFFGACNTGGTPTQNYTGIYIDGLSNNEQISLYGKTSNVTIINTTTNDQYRDPNVWHHLLLVVDTAQADINDRTNIYIDGVENATKSGSIPSLDYDSMFINKAYEHEIGARHNVSGNSFFDGFIADVVFIDGQALSPTDFGEFVATTNQSRGIWRPIDPRVLDFSGTNSFMLDFQDETSTTTLGYDNSGNDNHWTLTNIGTDHQSTDVPTNNSATMNALHPTSATSITEGGYVMTMAANSLRQWVSNIEIPGSGKWYFEVELTNANANQVKIGVDNTNTANEQAYYYMNDGIVYTTNGNEAAAATGSQNDVWGVAIDVDAGSVSFYQNNSLQKTTTKIDPSYSKPFIGAGAAVATINVKMLDEQWTYSAPSGHKSLRQKNMPISTEALIHNPVAYFDIISYTGDGTASQEVFNEEGFNVDLAWHKRRTSTFGWRTADSVRGATAQLALESNAVETVSTTEILSFPSGGVEFGNSSGTGTTSETYQSYQWSMGATQGLDVVTYTGTGVAKTESHSLGVAPSMIIVKKRDTAVSNWTVYHDSVTMGVDETISIDTSTGSTTNTGYWNSTAPTASVFSVGTHTRTNASGAGYVAWLFANIEGFSRTFAYTGNGATNGRFIQLNFKPRLVIIKRTDTTGNWISIDSEMDYLNPLGAYFLLDTTAGEGTFDLIDATSNGFKVINSGANTNANGGTYIGIAFAEIPFMLRNNGEFK